MTAPESSETLPGKFVRANGLDIYYEEHGQPAGPPLVLIHGGSLTGKSWKPYLAAFTESYRVLTPDTRGHGRTINPGDILSFGLLAEDVAAFVKELGLEKPFVAGYSDGGQTVLELGMRYPDLAQALIIGGAYPEVTAASLKMVESFFGKEGSEFDAAKFERENAEFVEFTKAEQGEDNWQNYLIQMKPLWGQVLNYTPADFAKVTAPTLLYRADRDDFVSIEEAVTMFRALPKAELAVVPGSDHGGLVFSPSKIALALPLILDFLQRNKHG